MTINNEKEINRLIDLLFNKLSGWLKISNGGNLELIDPNEGVEIAAHYGATHLMASMILLGKATANEAMIVKGYELLRSILSNIKQAQKLPAYHFDFNNFAIAIIVDLIDDSILKEQTISTLIAAPDSNHWTVNWLPMRMYVNLKKYQLTKDNKYCGIVDRCRKNIYKAINNDGSIEDRLPKGTSFNLQYDISTVALLHILNTIGENFDISESMGFLLQNIAPDGDINYQGRGTNQVFAWGPWIYLLSHLSDSTALTTAIDFLSPRLEKMIANDSMMLNDWHGKEKYLWWDYHYASVYTAHCLFWLVLSITSGNSKNINPILCPLSDSGIAIFRSQNLFVSIFSGRSEYLSEKGPAISAIYTNGIPLVKGCFGPWRGLFGNLNTNENAIIYNYCGLISTNRTKQSLFGKICHRLHLPLFSSDNLLLRPSFCPIDIKIYKDRVTIVWNNISKSEAFLNIPSINEQAVMNLFVDHVEIPLTMTMKIKNQYGWVTIYQSHQIKGSEWKLTIMI